MKLDRVIVASLIAACSLALSAQAAPPEGKGQGNNASNPGKGNGGKGNQHASGHPNKGNSGNDNAGAGNPGKGGADKYSYDTDRRYDDRGRYYDYFDDHRDRHGHLRGDDLLGDLVYAGITAALAREYALDFGLGGYSTLPPGIRENLARGKPLPPGIAKKMVPGSLLGRLPRHPGYEWRVAGTDLILISVATAVVADILYDVFD
ncbi:anti-virulence regulator CigR family protein [Pusillimonas sp. MFBS29]|uniref:anti-virulence regulator CigR family protein n=1 Tax=Pusillimonas sp. MFBS29 TaxID=2886690 RepID=UPI001D10D3A4|nr:anti-virulence regulator CigR family protein [Pusillimonas sp. MFBS29]MCC2595702.1 anti-virulence regulator CigR family protein [Pusillimonas sp. MFBS29]